MEVKKFYQLLIKQGFAFSTDSRNVDSGCIFFALKGDNFNGNKFALNALEKGASYAVVDEVVGDDRRLIQVDDVLDYFQTIATFHRKCFDIPIIAVAGSNGKTTTKNLMQSVLQSKFKTHCTAGNFNNHIGVPITLLSMPMDTEIGIIEIGTNNPGEIAALCSIVQPNYGIITNIGKEHLEGFGTLEAVAKEESELFAWLAKNHGKAFVNADDEWLVRMSRVLEKQNYSKNNCTDVALVPSISFQYKEMEFTSPLMGDYNLDNILAAIVIGEEFGVDLKGIAHAVKRYTPDNNRSQLIESQSNLIWLDAYNANPSSMQVAISNFNQLDTPNKVLILGDMFEMGKAAIDEHKALIDFIQSFNFNAVYLLGEHFRSAADDSTLKAYQSMEELTKVLKNQPFKNTAFLIKGSRGMKMERVLSALNIED